MSVTLNTTIKPRLTLADGHEGVDERRRVEATGETYEAAYAALMAQVPQGWIVIGIKRW